MLQAGALNLRQHLPGTCGADDCESLLFSNTQWSRPAAGRAAPGRALNSLYQMASDSEDPAAWGKIMTSPWRLFLGLVPYPDPRTYRHRLRRGAAERSRLNPPGHAPWKKKSHGLRSKTVRIKPLHVHIVAKAKQGVRLRETKKRTCSHRSRARPCRWISSWLC